MRTFTVLGFVFLSVVNGAVLAQSKVEPLQDACKTGAPWFLPAAPAGGETSILVVAGAEPAIRIRLCNCAAKEDGQTFIRVNPTTSDQRKKAAPAGKADTASSATLASQLYVGSCLDAMGNIITIRNTQPRDQRGTYLTR